MTDELTQYMWLRQQWHDLREIKDCLPAEYALLAELLEAWYVLTPDDRAYAAVLTDSRWPHDNDKYEYMLSHLHEYQEKT